MPNYEVYIPAKPNTDQKNMTVVVEAPTWLLALRAGMQKIGDQGDSLSSILCENQPDGSIVIKDPVSRRIFTIRETDTAESDDAAQWQQQAEEEAQKAREEAERLAREEEELRKRLDDQKRAQEERDRLEQEEAARKARQEEERRAKEQAEQLAREQEEAELRAMEEEERRQTREEEERRAREEAERKARQEAEQRAREEAEHLKQEEERRRQEAEERQRLEDELRAREEAREQASKKAADLADGKAREVATTYDEKPGSVSMGQEEEEEAVPFDPNEVLADLFERTMDLYTMNYEESFELIMDMAMDVIQAESGAIILSDYESPLRELYFIEARGPVANQIKSMRIPRGKGIVGFSVNTGVSLAINDVSRNPNWYQEIAKKSDYPTRSLLCVPINIEDRTFGAIELINKKGSDRWSNGEINVVNFLADKAAEVLATKAASVNIENI